jgi:hypothetical protein
MAWQAFLRLPPFLPGIGKGRIGHSLAMMALLPNRIYGWVTILAFLILGMLLRIHTGLNPCGSYQTKRDCEHNGDERSKEKSFYHCFVLSNHLNRQHNYLRKAKKPKNANNTKGIANIIVTKVP